jgi:hypothetical protein
MPSTYQLISSNVLTTNAASVIFSAIPSTYTDLVLRVSARTDQAAIASGLRVVVNGTNTGSFTQLQGDGTNAGSANATGNAFLRIGLVNGANSTSNTFSFQEMYIPNYAGSTNKPYSLISVVENNNTDGFLDLYAGLQNQTTVINSMTISPTSSVNFVSNSSFYLYGIKSS